MLEHFDDIFLYSGGSYDPDYMVEDFITIPNQLHPS